MAEQNNQNIENLGLTQLEEALRLCYNLFKWLFLLLVILFILSGIHTVSPGKVGYVQRLGEWLPEQEEPGLHFAWPFMIDRVYEFDLSAIRSIEIDDFVPIDGRAAKVSSSKVLLSSDHNLIHAKWSMHYKLVDPIASYRMFGEINEEEEKALMKQIFLGVCVREVASRDVKSLLGDQEDIKTLVKEGMQDYLSRLKTGYAVSRIDLVELRVPDKVKEAFDLVFAEAASKKQKIDEARIQAGKLERSIEAIQREKVGMAKALASQIHNDLRADARNLESLLKQLQPEDRKAYLETKLLLAMERAFSNNQQQMYFLREGSELRLKLSPDPLLDKLHRDRRREAEKALEQQKQMEARP